MARKTAPAPAIGDRVTIEDRPGSALNGAVWVVDEVIPFQRWLRVLVHLESDSTRRAETDPESITANHGKA